MTEPLRLDLAAGAVELTAVLVDVPSESRHEGPLADAVERALSDVAHLSVTRHGNTVVARTMLGRAERVLIGGHLDTVPEHGNLPHRIEGDLLFGLGACDMKGGVAVALSLAATVAEPVRDVTYVFYECEEVDATLNGLQALADHHPALLEADLAILMEPSDAGIEAGCQGTLRVDVRVEGRRAHSARSWLGSNAIHSAGARARPPARLRASAAHGRRPRVPRGPERGRDQRRGRRQRHPGHLHGHGQLPVRP